MQTLLNNPVFQAALGYIKADDAHTLKELLELVAIPAPSNEEKVRADEMMRRFQAEGLENVYMDEVWNVFGTIKGSKGSPVIMLAGHTDTVFPASVDVAPEVKDGIVYAPGINDDTRALAELLTIVRAIRNTGIQPVGDIIFCANVGEEGLGDLRGVKHIFKKMKNIDAFISIDNPITGGIVHCGTGSHRYRFSFQARGGHSFADFGQPSAIHAMGRAIAKISQFEVLKFPKTTFNVGVVEGGTSVNTIAAKAGFLLDIRSDCAEELKRLSRLAEKEAHKAVDEENEKWNHEEQVMVAIEQLGDRPAGIQADDCKIVQIATAAIEALGLKAQLRDETSTDANIPIALGIPAICVGRGGNEGGVHTVGEWFDPKEAYLGPQKDLLMIFAMAGLEGVKKPMIESRPR